MIDLSKNDYQWLVKLDYVTPGDWEDIKVTWECKAQAGGSEYVYLDDVIRIQANFWGAGEVPPDDYDNLHVAAVAENAANPWEPKLHDGYNAMETITPTTAATLLKGITMDQGVTEGCYFTGADYATAEVETDQNTAVSRIAYWQFKYNPASGLGAWELCFSYGDPHVGKTKHKCKSTEKRPKKSGG